MDIGFQGDIAKFNTTLSACLPGHGEVGPWSTDENVLVGG